MFAEKTLKDILTCLRVTAKYRQTNMGFIHTNRKKAILKGEIDLIEKGIELVEGNTQKSPEVFNLTNRDIEYLKAKGKMDLVSNDGSEIAIQFEEEVK
jgi:hypothetical protein